MKQIPLTQGKFALVDDADYEYLSQWKWRYISGYAVRWDDSRPGRERGLISMHREVMHAPDGMQVDHINGNGLDNRRENLRICTHAQNMQNTGKHASNTSGFKGVFLDKTCKSKTWRAQIRIPGHRISLGSFTDPESAARAYDAKARELHGEFANTNF